MNPGMLFFFFFFFFSLFTTLYIWYTFLMSIGSFQIGRRHEFGRRHGCQSQEMVQWQGRDLVGLAFNFAIGMF